MRHHTIYGGKTKALISSCCAVTAQLICVFGFACADCWFSDLALIFQMTQRLDMYAEELAEAIKPDYVPPVIKEN